MNRHTDHWPPQMNKKRPTSNHVAVNGFLSNLTNLAGWMWFFLICSFGLACLVVTWLVTCLWLGLACLDSPFDIDQTGSQLLEHRNCPPGCTALWWVSIVRAHGRTLSQLQSETVPLYKVHGGTRLFENNYTANVWKCSWISNCTKLVASTGRSDRTGGQSAIKSQ